MMRLGCLAESDGQFFILDMVLSIPFPPFVFGQNNDILNWI